MIARRIKKTLDTDSSHHAASSSAMKAPAALLLLACMTVLVATLPLSAGAAEYRLETVTEDLRWPWSLAELPDGGFLITEREGRLLHVTPSDDRRVVSGTPATLFAGQGGFFDVVLHPQFVENQLVYLSYAEGTESANGTAVFRARFVDGELRDGERILRVDPDKSTPQHYGGRMLFLPDGTLLLTTGDGFEHREEAQSLDSELGKVLRIDAQGGAAGLVLNSDREDKASRVWTYGHRNPQGLALAPPATIYLHEHGPRGGDELNILSRENNYGWPMTTHGVDYSGAYVSPFKHAPQVSDAIWVWVPSIAPSGMAWYAGGRFPEWADSLFIGALVDREVRRLAMRNGRVVKEEALFSELGERIRDVRVFRNELYLLTDGEQAKLLRVVPRR